MSEHRESRKESTGIPGGVRCRYWPMPSYEYTPKLTWPKDAKIAGRLNIVDMESGAVLYDGESRELKDGETLTLTWTRSDVGGHR